MNELSLEQILKTLPDKELPVLSPTVNAIVRLTGEEEASAGELAEIILRDGSMTARILKIVNAVYYNPNRNEISTISRAVVMLGVSRIRLVALSAGLVERLTHDARRQRLMLEMARSFHAAIQAKQFASRKGWRKEAEEVFIASLLYRLGDMAFWAYAEEGADRLEAALNRPNAIASKVEKEVLGFHLREITLALNREWALSNLLRTALHADDASDDPAGLVVIGHRLADAAERGWESAETKELLEEIAHLLGLSKDETQQMAYANARSAAKVAALYGCEQSSAWIPLPGRQAGGVPEHAPIEPRSDEDFLQPDCNLKWKILTELTEMLGSKPNPNLILPMVLEGIVRGIGMDRAVFALLSRDRGSLHAKSALGWRRDGLLQRFHFSLPANGQSLLAEALDAKHPLRIRNDLDAEQLRRLPREWGKRMGTRGFFAMPVVVDHTSIGLVYTDRSGSGRELDDASFAEFKQFCLHLNIGLAASRRTKH